MCYLKGLLIISFVLNFDYAQRLSGQFEEHDKRICRQKVEMYAQQNDSLLDLFKRVKVLTCQKQIVEGTNFKMTLRLSSGEQCSITLYQDLQGNVSVNDNHEDTCTQMAVSS